MRNSPWYPVVYMFIVTAVFSSGVIGLARFTRSKVEANQQLAFEKAVLNVCGLAEGNADSELHDIFIDRIQVIKDSGNVCIVIDEQGDPEGYILPLEGKGFWAPIKGVLGVDVDRRTITGIAFYEQNETPGLGGKIVEEEFTSQFAGKIIAESGEAIGIEPVSSQVTENQVHAITGATQTCSRLEKLINEGIGRWRENGEGKQ